MDQPENSSTPVGTTAATPVTQEPTASNGTASVTNVTAPATGDAATKATAPSEEKFTDIDVNTLPPELKSKHDSMLSDYKKKTAELAEQRREFESISEKAKLLDMMTSDPDIVNVWNQKYSQTAQQPEANPQDPAVIRQEVDVLRANIVVKDFKAKHNDFDELDSDGVISGYVRLNPPKGTSEKSYMETLEKAYNYAASLRNKWIETGKKQGLQRVSEKANQATIPPTSATPNVFTGDAKKLSVAEAVELARKGQRVTAGW